MSISNNGQLLIQLPFAGKDPSRLEAQIRNGILSLMDITCPVHTSNTVLDAVILERTGDSIAVELHGCCEACARRGETSIKQQCAVS